MAVLDRFLNAISGLNAFYDGINGGDVWINENRFRILRPICDGLRLRLPRQGAPRRWVPLLPRQEQVHRPFSHFRYGESPFEYALDESGGSLQLTVMNAQIKWPPDPPYPEQLRQFVVWMLQPHAAVRPHIYAITVHVDKFISKFSSEAEK